MKSHTDPEFWKYYNLIPLEFQKLALKNYRLWKENPRHPSIEFKKVHPQKPIYSGRVGRYYRVLGVLENNTMIWFWIGTHSDYDLLTHLTHEFNQKIS